MPPSIAELADRYWSLQLAADPISASMLGERGYDDRLPDRSSPAEEQRLTELRALLLDCAALDDEHDPITRAVLAHECAGAISHLESRAPEHTVSASVVGPQIDLFEGLPQVVLSAPEHAEALLARYRAVPGYFSTAVERLRQGREAERTPVERGVTQVIAQIDGYLGSPLDEDPFLSQVPPAGWDDAPRWERERRRVVEEHVRPGFALYRDALAHEVLPTTRPDDRCGLRWLPGGDDLYSAAVRRFTTLDDVSPQDLHDMGRQGVADLSREFRALGAGALGTTDLPQIFDRLRNDPSLRFETAEGIVAHAEEALRRAQEAVPRWFGRLPGAPCSVTAMGPHEEVDGTIAYYLPPAPDGSRPGQYMVNTYLPATRTRFEAEALAFHEAVPGHHLQIALAQELDLPEFRRHALVFAYAEGWALYTERLADEMGLYTSDLERLGMVAFDSWRACRLVVDTGMHHLGWSRDDALAYLHAHSPLAPANIANEVDRYIAWPGQALAYAVGQRHILRLRERARSQLGERFDSAAFHDVLLGGGPVPLAVLTDLVDAWLETV